MKLSKMSDEDLQKMQKELQAEKRKRNAKLKDKQRQIKADGVCAFCDKFLTQKVSKMQFQNADEFCDFLEEYFEKKSAKFSNVGTSATSADIASKNNNDITSFLGGFNDEK